MYNNKKEMGITLISIVVTIIVLLILAGVSISMLTGNNSIIQQTINAKEQTEIANEKEQITLAYINANTKKTLKNLPISVADIQNELDTLLGQNKTTVTCCGKGFDVLINDKNYYYTLSENGTLTDKQKIINFQYAGDITKNNKYDGTSIEKAYRIECIEDLVAFSNMTNQTGYVYKNGIFTKVQSRELFENKYIVLERNLDFNSKYSYNNWESTDFGNINGNDTDGNKLITEMTTGKGFNGISSAVRDPFSGTFNGNGFCIKNIYINSNEETALFIQNNGTVKNLIIDGKIVSDKSCAGITLNNSGIIESIINNIEVKSTINKSYSGVGGICAGNSGTIINCINCANIVSASNTAGICMNLKNNGKIINCYNEGIITVMDGEVNLINTRNASGIVALNMQDNGNSAYIFNCFNKGIINSDKSANVGIVGYNFSGMCNIKNSFTTTSISIGPGYSGKYIQDNVICLGMNNKYTHSYMISQEFINELNSYIENNVTSLDENWCKWIKGTDGYPTLDFNTTWNGTKWSNE